MLQRPLSIALLVAAVTVSSRASSGDTTPGFRTLEVGAKRPAWYHAPAAEPARRPLTVFLHGMCALPEWECPVFQGATGSSWLLCPPGPAACEGGGAMWVGTNSALARRVDKSIDLLAEREADGVDLGRRVLVGYSLGAPAALRIALEQPGRWQRLMIVNAGTEPSAAQLKKAGITRIALVAGEADGTAAKLKRTAKRLASAGVEARYFSMGKVGHYFDRTSAERLTQALTWIGAEWPSPS
jgi:predicted esterase